MRDFTPLTQPPAGHFRQGTNLRNGRPWWFVSMTGVPWVDGRIIDLSYNAARALGFKELGLQTVRLDLYHPTNVAAVGTRSQPQLNPIHSATRVHN